MPNPKVQKAQEHPLKMEDGRQFTDYRPRNVLDSTIRAQNKIKNNFDYRMFLTNNADKVLHNFRHAAAF
jgi:hypothetical protein